MSIKSFLLDSAKKLGGDLLIAAEKEILKEVEAEVKKVEEIIDEQEHSQEKQEKKD